MAVSDYSTDPNQNNTISGINIGEGMPPANVNNAMRQMMADTKGLLDNDIPTTDDLMPKDGGTFEGTQPLYDGEGAFLHHAQATNSSGRVFILPVGTDNPSSPLNGDIVFFYTP